MPPDLAATYLVGFYRSQGFRDGNRRTAPGEADDEAVARYLLDRIEPAE